MSSRQKRARRDCVEGGQGKVSISASAFAVAAEAAAEAAAAAAAAAPVAPPLKVVSWNVLAHVHTHWCRAAHQHTGKLESPGQCRRRQRSVLARLKKLAPDVALLQEVDSAFIPIDWLPGTPLPCGETLTGYTVIRNYNRRANVDSGGHVEGTAVLIRDAVLDVDAARCRPARLEATRENGWKTGLVVHARPKGTPASDPPMAFGSVHLRYLRSGTPEPQRALLESALAAISPRCTAVVIAGDFNYELGRLGDCVFDVQMP